MNKGIEVKRATLVSSLTASNPSSSAVTSGEGTRRPETPLPGSRIAQADQADRVVLMRQRRRRGAAKDPSRPVMESVESLAKYKPRSRKYEVSLTFSGEAGAAMSDLMAELRVNSPNEVVKLTIALLVSARGKEILLRDPRTGIVEIVEL